MDKRYLKQLAIDSIGTNFGYDEMTEEEQLQDLVYSSRLKIQELNPEERKIVLKYQEKYKMKHILKQFFNYGDRNGKH